MLELRRGFSTLGFSLLLLLLLLFFNFIIIIIATALGEQRVDFVLLKFIEPVKEKLAQ